MKKTTITLGSIKMSNGCAANQEVRTAATEVNLPPETEVEFISTQSRMVGTGYRDSLYRICGTDDALVVHHNCGGPDNIWWEQASLSRGYFARRRNYAREVGKIARFYPEIPFGLALVLGVCPDAYELLLAALEAPGKAEDPHGLWCGIGRRKQALREILGDNLYTQLGVEGMGQAHSERLARFVGERLGVE